MGEEGREDVLAEVEAGVLTEVKLAERAGVFDLLTVVPGAHHEEELVVGGVFGLDRLLDGDGAVDVLLVPERVDEQRGDGERLFGEDLVERLVAPEGVIRGMRGDLVPEADLLHAALFGELAGGAGAHPHIVVVVVACPPVDACWSGWPTCS